MERKESNNYEKMRDRMAKVFLRYDQEKMIQKFNLEYDENNLYLCFLNRPYRISRQTGRVTWSEDGFVTENPADYNAAMTIYDVLCCSKEDCCLSQEWVSVGSLSSVLGGTLKKGSNFFQNAAEAFTGKTNLLAKACERLGGRKLEKGDAAYELLLFPFLPVVLRFWDADEEFPASMQILTDRNILDFMRYETLMFAVSHVLQRVKEEMA